MRKHLTKRVSLIVVITTLIFFCSQILFFAVFLPKIYDSNTQSIKFQIVEFDKEYAESLCESLFDDTIGDEHLLAMEIQSKNDQGDALVTQDQDFLKTNNNSYCTGKLVAYKQSGFHFYDDDDQNGLGKFWYLTIRLNDKQSLLFSANKDQFVETLVLIIGEVIFAILLSLLVAFLLVSRFSKKFVQPFNEVRYDEDDRLDASQITTRYPEMLKFFEHISNQAKLRRQFTANVSHEFKTPLAVLAAKNDTARRAFEKGDTVKILKSFEETERLLKETSKVIDLLLELGKIDEGDYHLNITEFNIKDTIGSILKHSAEKASGNASSFATRIDQLNNITITSDRMLVREIMMRCSRTRSNTMIVKSTSGPKSVAIAWSFRSTTMANRYRLRICHTFSNAFTGWIPDETGLTVALVSVWPSSKP